MLAPLKYQGTDGLGESADGLAAGPSRGTGLALLEGTPGVTSSAPPLTTGATAGKRIHPLHWLVDGHWLGQWRTPLLLKLWRYGAGSIVAFVVSVFTVFACFSWIGLGATTSAVIAFFAGAIPNWILNRRWAWQQRGREGVARETSLYALVSLLSLVASTAVTKVAAVEATHVGHLMRDLLVTASYTFTIVVLTGLKYLAYDRWVFIDRSAASTSRNQVPSTTDPKRNP
jgi:putative flippase GtrA